MGDLVDLGGTLDDAAFSLPTACPGWTVKDQFSHVIGTELLLEGASAPDAAAPPGAHVRNELGELNERFVEARRAVAGPRVVAELAELAARRLAALRELDAEAWDALGPSPIGMVPYVDYMGLRVFDSWVHDQDVRGALGRPGARGGAGERVALDRMEASMPFVLGRRVAPAPGTTLRIDVIGALGRTVQLVVVRDDEGRPRARATSVIEGPPTATLRVDEDLFVRRACGRIGPEALLGAPTTAIAGDAALVTALVGQMVVLL